MVKSIKELEAEIKGLKKAEAGLKHYATLTEERKKLTQEIKKEGFKQRHKKALGILNKAGFLASKYAKQYAKRYY